MKNNLQLQTGDIFLTNDYSTASKVVRFLMTAPTIYHHILWKITGRIERERPNFYHAGMVLNEKEIIEQGRVVQIKPIDRIFRKDYVIWRKRKLSNDDKNALIFFATGDLGEGYGVLECFGKFLTWITGIKWFCKWFNAKNRAICVVKVCEWFWHSFITDFGVDNANYMTSKIIYDYWKAHPEEGTIIEEKITEVIKKWNLLGEEIR